MRVRAWKHGIALVAALLIVLVSVAPAFSAGTVRVFVEYRPGEQENVRAALRSSGAEFHYQFERLSSFVVSLPEHALGGLRRNPAVLAIEEDPVRKLVRSTSAPLGESILPVQEVPFGIDMVQAREVWDANLDGKVDKRAPTGAGRTVCIIDTGFYAEHEDFAGVDVLGGTSQVDDNWAHDGYGHGTHVAGTITAANNAYGVVGVTPGTASLYIVKIFDDAGLWVSKAHASDLIEAAYLCADNGANIISMSLGGGNRSGKEEQAFQSLYDAGILSVAAASNDGLPDYSYPASYDSVVSVAAIDADGVVADFSNYNDQVELAAPGVDVLSTIPYISSAFVRVDGVEYTALPMEFSLLNTPVSGALLDGGLCLAADPAADWSGKVVLCSRGEVSFAEKVTRVMDNGGAAAVIYNNAPGIFSGTLGEEGDWIVAVSISQEDGLYLVANALGKAADVISNMVAPASGYEAWSGTSMATPHVSGVAALIWSANPSWSNVQIREALKATAKDLGEPGYDIYYGYGLVQAKDALLELGYKVRGKQ